MVDIPLAEAKARLSELVERVAAGDEIVITKRGKPVVRLSPVEGSRKRIDVEALRRAIADQPYQTQSAGDFIRHMRDTDRY